MTRIKVGTPVTAPITPGLDDSNVWPTHLAKYGKGGLEVVDTISDRDAITADRREDKAVLVRVGADGEPALFEFSNGSWNQVDLGDGTGSTNMTFEDGTFSAGSIDTAIVNSMTVRQGSNAGSAVLTPYTTFTDERTDGTTDEGGQVYVPVEANKVALLSPLQMFSDPNEDLGVIMEIKHDAFEPLQAPGYLAYVDHPIEVIARTESVSVHKDGMIWPMDIVVNSDSTYIALNPKNKSVGLQEGDSLDPNITGGTDFIVSYRISLAGTAPNDGNVTIYLSEGEEFDGSSTITKDVNGSTMAAEKNYKSGDKLGDLEVTGVINAKGLKNLNMHVVHNFIDNNIVINERAKGISGIMVQVLSDKGKTGKAVLQYELDTHQTIEFSRIWLGADRMSFSSVLSTNSPKKAGKAGEGITLIDGIHFYNPQPAAIEVSNGQLIITDDGSNICDFSLGKFFPASETVALRDKKVTVDLTLGDNTGGWNVELLKWTGTPDKYTKELFTSRNGGGIPIFQEGWSVADVHFISEDTSPAPHQVSKEFTVPDDANNYAIVIIPVEAESPMKLTLSRFDLSVVNPFYMYEMYLPVKLDEIHLRDSKQHLETVQDNQKLGGVRYTINNAPDGLPMPCGKIHSGRADIVLDSSVNQVAGSAASGGEGALKFLAEGIVNVDTTLRIWSEQPKGTNSVVNFWWVNIAPNGAMSKIIKSETSFNIPGGSQVEYTMKPFEIRVASGDRIALRASADKADGAFIESVSPKAPMVTVKLDFDELLPAASDDPFAGLDLAQFDTVYSASMAATKVIVNRASMVIPIEVPEDQNLAILNAIKQMPDGTIRPVEKLDWSYSNDKKQLAVSFGETVQLGMITIGIYL